MKQDNILSMLGLAKRSNSIVSGEFSTEKAIKEKKACLVIVANDASANTKKLFTNKCDFYGVPLKMYSDKISLGHAIGCEVRTSVAVLDEGFAQALVRKMEIE